MRALSACATSGSVADGALAVGGDAAAAAGVVLLADVAGEVFARAFSAPLQPALAARNAMAAMRRSMIIGGGGVR